MTVFLFVGPMGNGELERWVAGARLAAARDLITQLAALPAVSRIVVATADPELPRRCADWPVTWDVDPPATPFHFGRRLAGLMAVYPAEAYAYFGAGCAPLLGDDTLAEAFANVTQSAQPLAVTNNALSSDWLVLNCPQAVQSRTDRLGRDNMLGPVLKYEAGIEVRGLPVSAAARADIDTPADVVAFCLYPNLRPHLARYLSQSPPSTFLLERWRSARERLFMPGSRVTLIGRVAASVWVHLEARTRCWTRVFSEERGMAASGRQAAGRVCSLIAAHLQRIGPAAFFAELAEMTDVVFFDTRVALAALGRWPSAGDRYASDALQPEAVSDDFLRELTVAARTATLPVLLGGHSLVTGDLLLLLDSFADEPNAAMAPAFVEEKRQSR
ncbi:MAG: hypothetical protein NZM11_04620 [Anaerolineales bacterium]|nr:hypothetical protein [Anaerolineales bacterium]